MSAEPSIKGVVGVRRPASDTDKPEMVDSAKRRRWRVSVGDAEDVQSLWGYILTLFLIIVAAGSIGFAIRLFLWGSGFREVLF